VKYPLLPIVALLALNPIFSQAEESLGDDASLFQDAVINGQPVPPSSRFAKMTVAIAAVVNRDGKTAGVALCTGTLIARDLVLTAAHCVNDEGGGQIAGIAVVLNANLTDAKVDPSHIMKAASWVTHPKYLNHKDARGSVNTTQDLALIKLPAPVGPEMLLAEMPKAEVAMNQDMELVLAGFGQTNAANEKSVGKLFFSFTTGRMLPVAGSVDHHMMISTGAQICHGDSGGPVYRANAQHIMIVGVNSIGDCKVHGEATSVAFNLNWIRSAGKTLGSEVNF